MYYTGITHDLCKRILEHNNELSQFTKSGIPWKLVWYCVYVDKYKATQFEKYLKTASGIAFRNKRLI